MKVHNFSYLGDNYSIRVLDNRSANILKGKMKICNIDSEGNITLGDYSGVIALEEIWKILSQIWKFASSFSNSK